MRKVNVERKCDMALCELLEVLRLSYLDDKSYVDVMRFRVSQAISYLCMLDDWVVEEKTTYYCLSEIERNINNLLEERKRKQYENGNK